MEAKPPIDPVSTDGSSTLRERRRDYTQGEIARAAIDLFDEHGFDVVTVEDITAAVGISPRTFFRYFATKEDLVLREHERAQRRLVRALDARPADEGPVGALRNAFVESSTVTSSERVRVLRYGRVQIQTRALNARMIGLQALGNAAVIDAVAKRMGVDPRVDPRPETVVLAMTAVASATFRRWVTAGGRGTPSDSIAACLDLLLEGLERLDQSGLPG